MDIYQICHLHPTDEYIPSVPSLSVLSFHKQVQPLLNRHGHRLLFLPPYSSDLSPIEKTWAVSILSRLNYR
ncbi:transposase [Psychrobacter pygoscelis]|uniref:transposase n=1 Tax=Psychrobacter pygoscelis TaxID=2488563 RepID=UPI0031013814